LGYGTKATRDLMKTMRIKDIMIPGVVTVAPEAELCEAVRLMLDHKIGCLPVVDNDRLVGLITETDILVQYMKDCGQGS
jgi:acetoin utilization protein AcuB